MGVGVVRDSGLDVELDQSVPLQHTDPDNRCGGLAVGGHTVAR